MDRLHRERDEDAVRPPEPAAPEPVRAGSLEWASALGNQAVARLARQAEEVAEPAAEEAPEPVMEEAEPEAAGPDVDDLAEDEIPE